MKHLRKFDESKEDFIKKIAITNDLYQKAMKKPVDDDISDDFYYYAEQMIMANDGDLGGHLQAVGNSFFEKYNIDTSLTTIEITEQLFDILGNSGVDEMKSLLEE